MTLFRTRYLSAVKFYKQYVVRTNADNERLSAQGLPLEDLVFLEEFARALAHEFEACVLHADRILTNLAVPADIGCEDMIVDQAFDDDLSEQWRCFWPCRGFDASAAVDDADLYAFENWETAYGAFIVDRRRFH